MRSGLLSAQASSCHAEPSSYRTTRASCVVVIAKGGANIVMQAIAGSLLSVKLSQTFGCHKQASVRKKLIKAAKNLPRHEKRLRARKEAESVGRTTDLGPELRFQVVRSRRGRREAIGEESWLSSHIHCFYHRKAAELFRRPTTTASIHMSVRLYADRAMVASCPQFLYHTPLGYMSREKRRKTEKSYERQAAGNLERKAEAAFPH